MADDTQHSESDVSSSIVAGMTIVHNLFNELDKLFRLIAQGLVALDVGIGSFHGKGFILPKAKKGATVADRFLKTDMGFYAAKLGTQIWMIQSNRLTKLMRKRTMKVAMVKRTTPAYQ